MGGWEREKGGREEREGERMVSEGEGGEKHALTSVTSRHCFFAMTVTRHLRQKRSRWESVRRMRAVANQSMLEA